MSLKGVIIIINYKFVPRMDVCSTTMNTKLIEQLIHSVKNIVYIRFYSTPMRIISQTLRYLFIKTTTIISVVT